VSSVKGIKAFPSHKVLPFDTFFNSKQASGNLRVKDRGRLPWDALEQFSEETEEAAMQTISLA